MDPANVIERAFQIAPECQSVFEVRKRLRREGYIHVDAHFAGRAIKDQIKQMLRPSEP